MEAIRYCTLTGVDSAVDVDRLIDLSRRYQLVEWGVLYSAGRAEESGGVGRYPAPEWIQGFVERVAAERERDSDLQVNLALHLCGKDAVAFLNDEQRLMPLMKHFGRVQLNVAPSALAAIDPQILKAHLHLSSMMLDGTTFILQEGATNAAIVAKLKERGGIEVLFDSSGGRGIARSDWPRIELSDTRGSRHGYAGGLGPDNIAAEFVKISAAANQVPYWIDMESKIRSPDDRFDLDACEAVLESVTKLAFAQTLRKGDHLDKQAPGEESAVHQVSSLEGRWLDWWALAAAGYRMSVPPENFSRPTTFSRVYGDWTAMEPSAQARDFDKVIADTEIGVVKRNNGKWYGIGVDHEVPGATRQQAMLRTLIADAFGLEVPVNPCHHPKIQASWFGEEFAQAQQPAPTSRVAPG